MLSAILIPVVLSLLTLVNGSPFALNGVAESYPYRYDRPASLRGRTYVQLQHAAKNNTARHAASDESPAHPAAGRGAAYDDEIAHTPGGDAPKLSNRRMERFHAAIAQRNRLHSTAPRLADPNSVARRGVKVARGEREGGVYLSNQTLQPPPPPPSSAAPSPAPALTATQSVNAQASASSVSAPRTARAGHLSKFSKGRKFRGKNVKAR